MISVVIPNFNGAKLLAKNLPKLVGLLEKSKLEYELILADDASSDDSIKQLEKFTVHGSRFTVIRNEKNRGFASTIDAGIRAAKGEVVFTIKTDSVPESADYFMVMLDHLKNPSVFSVSAALKTRENGKEEIRGSGEIYFEKGYFLNRRGSNLAKTSAWSDGSASAFRRDLYLKIGGFDKLYNPFYWEDVDLGYRAWKAGYQIDFEPNAVLLHDFESGAIAKHYSRQQIKIISLRNQLIFVWKNADVKHLLLYSLWKTYHFVVAIKNGDEDFFQAYFQAILKWPGILAARFRQRKVTKLSDYQALRVFQEKNR